jgi:hypothetical protein
MRTYEPRQNYLRRGPFDGSFECQLPVEARTELLEEIPPPQTDRIRETPTLRPAQEPEVFLRPPPPVSPVKPRVRVKAIGTPVPAEPVPAPRLVVTLPPPPVAPPQPVVIPEAARPAQRESRGGTGIWLVAGAAVWVANSAQPAASCVVNPEHAFQPVWQHCVAISSCDATYSAPLRDTQSAPRRASGGTSWCFYHTHAYGLESFAGTEKILRDHVRVYFQDEELRIKVLPHPSSVRSREKYSRLVSNALDYVRS